MMLVTTVTAISAQKKNPAPANVSHIKVHDVFSPAPYGSVQIAGYLGNKLDLCIENRVMAQDLDRLIQPFFLRNDGEWGFRSDFWGKWFTSAMMGYGYAPDENHKKIINTAVDE